MRCAPSLDGPCKAVWACASDRAGIWRRISSKSDGDRPLLPDFLGAGGGTPSSTKRLLPARWERLQPRRDLGQRNVLREAADVRERPVVAVALRQGQALPPPVTRHDPRKHVSSQLVRGSETLRIMSALPAYCPELEENAEPAKPSSLDFREVRLQVRPQHREELRALACKKVLYNFLQELRDCQQQSEWDDPLWPFEWGAARKALRQGDMALMVRSLARTHLHVLHGPLRQSYVPGRVTDITITEIQKELRKEWKDLQQKVGTTIDRPLDEDAIFRQFLDAELSWTSTWKLLQAPENVSSASS